MADSWVVRLNGSEALARDDVGGKAWSVNRMRALGIRTPPAVVLTIAASRAYQASRSIPDAAWRELLEGLRIIEAEAGRTFGGSSQPLLVSVRSGAARSMPGMMDTVLNLGMNDAVEAALARESGDPVFAAATRTRFEREFRATVLGDPAAAVPRDPVEQLRLAVMAVFDSWSSPRAQTYRRHHGLTDEGGTAVTVQAMVFGNLDDRSGTGVLFSRNPLTGERQPFGEWLPRAQGEDVVSGRHTPVPFDRMRDVLPDAYEQLLAACRVLETDGRDVQDIEFTVERGTLWLLQTRAAKRSARAAVRFAMDLCDEGAISVEEALARVTPDQVRSLLQPQLDPAALDGATLLASGEPASPGFAHGAVVIDPDTAMERGDTEDLILVRDTTSPDDIHGMIASRGIVTATGGATSHAAVVSREIGVPCVVGCGSDVLTTLAGRTVTVDGAAGKVYDGRIEVVAVDESNDPALARLTEWARSRSPLQVMLPGEAVPSEPTQLDHRDTSLARAAAGATGTILDSDAGVALAVRTGFTFIVTSRRLPALLAAIRERSS
jgi:pyruvate, orthophosphate dikinase